MTPEQIEDLFIMGAIIGPFILILTVGGALMEHTEPGRRLAAWLLEKMG